MSCTSSSLVLIVAQTYRGIALLVTRGPAHVFTNSGWRVEWILYCPFSQSSLPAATHRRNLSAASRRALYLQPPPVAGCVAPFSDTQPTASVSVSASLTSANEEGSYLHTAVYRVNILEREAARGCTCSIIENAGLEQLEPPYRNRRPA